MRSVPQVLLLVPYFNREGVGEDYSNYKWIEGIAGRFQATVLTIARPGHVDRLPESATLVEFQDSRLNLALERASPLYGKFARQACPNYVVYFRNARRWILDRAKDFDLIHQFSPLALRYPSPAMAFLRRSSVPFLAGPLGGALPTPAVLRSMKWLPELRQIDRVRFRFDPWLRETYTRADLLLGAAPYVRELLSSLALRRFEVMSEMGVEQLTRVPRDRGAHGLRLLFVGRLVPTKGVLHAIRCLALLADKPEITLRIAGVGELGRECEQLVRALGLEKRVKLLGRLTRAEVFEEYRNSDVFLFPSYREPTGHVIYEALSFGMPVVTTTVGGPAYIVTDSCGIRVAPAPAGAFEASLAAAVRKLHEDPALRESMGAAALARIEDVALWPRKVDAMECWYEDLLRGRRP